MNMGMARMMGGKGRHASMISAAYAAKTGIRQSDGIELRARESMQASAKRWANSTEGRAVNVASKKPAASGAGAKNRAQLAAILSETAKHPAAGSNRAAIAPLNGANPITSSERNQATLAALLRD